MHADNEKHLVDKLGYLPGEGVDTVDAPDWFLEYLRGNGVHTNAKLPTEWLHMFMTRREQTEHFMMHLKFNEIQKGLWISWPKKSSGIHADITEQDLRDIVLPYGWVDVKVCAVDDTWSALKFVRRVS
jgi:hypothetical protein